MIQWPQDIQRFLTLISSDVTPCVYSLLDVLLRVLFHSTCIVFDDMLILMVFGLFGCADRQMA